MIYTIGHTKNYLDAIANSLDGKIQKLGRCEPGDRFPDGYEGGYAFRSIADAQKRIDEVYSGQGFGVFGIEADWEKDTVPAQDGWWHNLVKNADIVVLE